MSTRKLLKKFEKIYNQTYNNTLKYIICMCGNLDIVDDIIQDTYLEFYKVLKDKKEILNVQAYIIKIAKNKIIQYINYNNRIDLVSITRESNDEEITLELDSRHRHRIRLYYKVQYR